MPSEERDGHDEVFVFAVVGDGHVQQAQIALSFLKRVTRRNIIVVHSRSSRPPVHERTVEAAIPSHLDDRAAAAFLKTNIHTFVPLEEAVYCYLDSDVIAVNSGIDEVFRCRSGVINFAADISSIDVFSPWALRCGCDAPACGHLRQTLATKFGVSIPSADWQLMNSGVFLFDAASVDFLDLWGSMTARTLADPYFVPRDQGALAAALWLSGLEGRPAMDSAFNFIVDCMHGRPRHARAEVAATALAANRDYALSATAAPHAVHLINGGVGRTGWANWDELEQLRSATEGQSQR
ncbi:hypothetical protein GCM10010994_48860 [Chelatococcus reniformis]|uniref:Uncharacterized protein n=2 Tax=Chelatococcus reniformis TaxID=1494448 RepID=A0A916XNB8_9HYPH|nr:hypothetical protein GCM10010994_48860 [Chelatococcus reniformis]